MVIAKHLRTDVFSTCADFIRTVPALQHDRGRAEDIDTGSEDHVADEARYACMSRPWTPKPTEPVEVIYSPTGKPIPLAPRKWKYLSELSYDEFHAATGSELGKRGRRRERV